MTLLVVGVAIYVWLFARDSSSGQVNYQILGMFLILASAILALMARYDAKKRDGTKGKLREAWGGFSIVLVSLGVVIGVIYSAYIASGSEKENLSFSMPVGAFTIAGGTLSALFMPLERNKNPL